MTRTAARKAKQTYRAQAQQNRKRRLSLETLEPRQMMAVTAAGDSYETIAGRALNVNGLSTGYAGGELQSVASFAVPDHVAQIEYSAEFGVLFLRSAAEIHVIDTRTRSLIDTHLATWNFSDMDLSPDGSYLFAADDGGVHEGIPHYVHRFDLASLQWEIKLAPAAVYQIEAVDARRVLLHEFNQHVDISLNDFGAAPASPMVELSRVYSDPKGDLEFDHRSGRIYHGDSSSSSSTEIQVRQIAGDGTVLQYREETEAYGTADDFGGSTVLSSDGQRFYYGRLQVEATDVTNNLHVFPEVIYAATSRLAFGQNGIYDAETGSLRDTLGFASQVYFVADNGLDIWAFDDVTDTVHHYRPGGSRSGVLVNDIGTGQLTATLFTQPAHGEVTFREDGSFSYVPTDGFVGSDTFTYLVQDGGGATASANVVIEVAARRPEPMAVNDNYTTQAGVPVVVDSSAAYDFPELDEVSQFRAPGNATKIVHAQGENLLFLLTGSTVRVIDAHTEAEIGTRSATQTFTDLDLTPDGRYLYVAEYGGPNPHSNPANRSYLHRFDLITRQWETKATVRSAFQLEAIDGRRVVTTAGVQYAQYHLYDFGDSPEGAVSLLASVTTNYGGDFEHDPSTGRLLHGGSGSSPQIIQVVQVDRNSLTSIETTGQVGTAKGHGGTAVLNSNGSRFYYGRLQVNSLNVRQNLNVFPEPIHAASPRIAFGKLGYYDALTGEARGQWGFEPSAMTVSADGEHVWAFDPEGDVLHRYRIRPTERFGLLINDRDTDGDPLIASLLSQPEHGTVELNQDGTFSYTPDSGFSGIDLFTYTATDATGQQSQAQVTITVTRTANDPTRAMDDEYRVSVGQTLMVGVQPWRTIRQHKALSFAVGAGVKQIEYSPSFDLVFARTASEVRIFNSSTGESLGERLAVNTFTDMDLTYDGRYLFVADHGGERMGTNNPLLPHYVHRYDLATLVWDVQRIPTTAYRLEAVDRNHVLLQQRDGRVDITYNEFSDWPSAPMKELSRVLTGWYGDFEYDPRKHFIYHGDGGTSHDIFAHRLANAAVTYIANTTFSSQGHGGSTVLSSDGKRFYYGRLQVEALAIQNNVRVFPEVILAATGQVAFGATGYYDAQTGARLGDVGFQSEVWFASDDGDSVWAADGQGMLHRFDLLASTGGVLLNDTNSDGDRLQVEPTSQPQHGTLSIDPSGAFVYVPNPGFEGLDQFKYRAVDPMGVGTEAFVRIQVTNGTPTNIQLENGYVSERVFGATVGTISISDENPNAVYTISVSDARFIVRDGVLRLKNDASLNAAGEPVIPLNITIFNQYGFGYSKDFQLTVRTNELPWKNPVLNQDVDDDGEIEPIDALIIINDLNARGPRELDWVAGGDSSWYLDPSGDGFLAPEDALIVINYLNRNLWLGGEAETSQTRAMDNLIVSEAATDSVATSAAGELQPDSVQLTDLAIAWLLQQEDEERRSRRIGASL